MTTKTIAVSTVQQTTLVEVLLKLASQQRVSIKQVSGIRNNKKLKKLK
jgi:hypothetical protein